MKKSVILFCASIFLGIASIAQPSLPIGVFDSGTGGLTVLEAMLTLDAFNNQTGKPGSDGIPDFKSEHFQYLADQANMPYGNYAAEKKIDLLQENILNNIKFLTGNSAAILQPATNEGQFASLTKKPVKLIVVACNTATAYALEPIKKHLAGTNIPCIGVIDAGAKAALMRQQKQQGTIGVFATAGTVASDGYPKALKKWAAEYKLQHLSIVSQSGVGLAESIDRDWSYYSDTLTKARTAQLYKGPSLKNNQYAIDTALFTVYQFNKKNNALLCEYDANGNCTDVQLNHPENYVRYHLVALLEKMLQQNYTQPLNTLILGCTHYPFMRNIIQTELKRLYQVRHQNGQYRYRKVLSSNVVLVNPAYETAKEAYVALRSIGAQNNVTNALPKAQFFISVPNTHLKEIQLQQDGWFTYNYKYGRVAGAGLQYVQYVPFNHTNISSQTYQRIYASLPKVAAYIQKAL